MAELALPLVLSGGRVAAAVGPLPASAEVELRVDEAGISLVGGEPRTAWQIPFAALGEPRAQEAAGELLVVAWVAGGRLEASFPLGGLGDASADELDQLLARRSGRRQGAARPRRPRARVAMLVVGVACLAAAALLIGLSLARDASARQDAAKARERAALRASAASKNLTAAQLPDDFSRLDPSAAALGGFLSTGEGSPDARARTVVRRAERAYQRCVRIPDAEDRVFGAAGVHPQVEVPGAPYGRAEGVGHMEVGTVTQRYASAAQVAADQRQIGSARFASCFAEAIGRIAAAGGDPARALDELPVVDQQLGDPLGARVTGASVTIPLGGPGAPGSAELGVTVLTSGPYEQTLFTLASPGSFPEALRASVVSAQAARLAGQPASTGA